MTDQFKLSFDIPEFSTKIEYGKNILFLGSCFSDEIAVKAKYQGFKVQSNPFGTIFHPLALSRFINEIDKKYVEFEFPQNKREIDAPRSLNPKTTTVSTYGKGYGMQVGKQLFSSTSVSIPVSANFVAGDNNLLAEGDEVEHQRFGKGQVLKLEDSGENKKAIINFTQAGQKTLVLKFAKLMKI